MPGLGRRCVESFRAKRCGKRVWSTRGDHATAQPFDGAVKIRRRPHEITNRDLMRTGSRSVGRATHSSVGSWPYGRLRTGMSPVNPHWVITKVAKPVLDCLVNQKPFEGR